MAQSPAGVSLAVLHSVAPAAVADLCYLPPTADVGQLAQRRQFWPGQAFFLWLLMLFSKWHTCSHETGGRWPHMEDQLGLARPEQHRQQRQLGLCVLGLTWLTVVWGLKGISQCRGRIGIEKAWKWRQLTESAEGPEPLLHHHPCLAAEQYCCAEGL